VESIEDEGAPIRWYLTYFHEAGHALAACDRNRPVHEIFIHPDKGYTRHGDDDTKYEGDDHQFIVWAGPWAEARAFWEFQGKSTRGAEGHAFSEQVRSFLRKNSSDWFEFHQAMGREVTKDDAFRAYMSFIGEGDPPDGECEPDAEWDVLLDGLWGRINTLATNLIAEHPVITVDPRQKNMVQVPKLWRMWGWDPPEDKHENPA
jgi:hypothetical protein